MTDTYFKAVRPDGRDFYTGTIDYLAGGVIEHPAGPYMVGAVDAVAYLSVSTVATDCTGFRWPARLLEVEPVSDVWTPNPEGLPNKRAVSALRVVRELDPHLMLGPQGDQVGALIERAKTLTREEMTDLAAAWDAAWDAVRDAAWDAAWDAVRDAAWDAAWDAVRDAVRDAAWDAAGAAAWDAVRALVVRDLIGSNGFTQAHYDLFTGPWRRTIGPLHPDDEDLSAARR